MWAVSAAQPFFVTHGVQTDKPAPEEPLAVVLQMDIGTDSPSESEL